MTIEYPTILTKDIEKMEVFYLKFFEINANEKYFNSIKKSVLILFRFQAKLELN